MTLYFWVFLGSGLGGLIRFAISEFMTRSYGETFPWGTFTVNILGSFIIGFFATLTATEGRFFVGTTGRNFFMAGVLGGFTTYSSFSLQTFTLAYKGEWLRAGANAGGTFISCFIAVWLGYLCAVWLGAQKGA
ncbi:MAG: fluoride efflux transporter CrcB [Puniceicoccales bacterium]|jgi:CrcB protein|nr:fluoride efflux transporter CrcB [Puniceicoccales bacterium]